MKYQQGVQRKLLSFSHFVTFTASIGQEMRKLWWEQQPRLSYSVVNFEMYMEF